MDAKCGRIHKALEFFNNMHYANTMLWTITFREYAIYGYNKDALKHFHHIIKLHMRTNTNIIIFVFLRNQS